MEYTSVDTTIDYYFHENAPDERLPKDYFSIRWTGKLIPEQSAEYWIASNTDDGTRVWINDSLIIDDWNQHGAKYNVAKIQLQKGIKYDFKMEYMELIGKAQVSLQWKLNSD